MTFHALLIAAPLGILSACGGGATTAPPAPAGGIPAGWTLTWADEFEIDGLPDAGKWDYDTARNQVGWYNDELQYYARDRAENARVENGKLIIAACKERLETAADFGGQHYTSARLVTRGKAAWTYGFFEVRAKLPSGPGSWPAIWMLGTKGIWPDDGEIDIMEQAGKDPGKILGTIHTKLYNGMLGTHKGGSTPVSSAGSEFHRYQLTWTADEILIGVDDTNFFRFANPKDNDAAQWPFDNPQYLLLNLAVGGTLGGVVDDRIFPQQMEIDYVRVYQPSK